jgi:hypothetical protein
MAAYFKFKKKLLAYGLEWFVAADHREKVAVDEVQGKSGLGKFGDLYCFRNSNVHRDRVAQVGVSSRGNAHKAGMISLASLLANAYPSSWGGIFNLSGVHVVILVRDAIILHNGDKYFGMTEKAKALTHLRQEFNKGGMEFIACSKEYALELKKISSNVFIPGFENLMERAKFEDTFCKLKVYMNLWHKIIIGSIVAGFGLGGFLIYAFFYNPELLVLLMMV